MMTMVGLDCNGDLATMDLTDIPSGWVPFTNAPPGTIIAVSVDSLSVIYIVNTDGEVYYGTDADGWTMMDTEETHTCTDVSVTLEGAIWLACEDDEGNNVAAQMKIGHQQIHFFSKWETNMIAGFHLAYSAIVSSNQIYYSDIFGLNKLINSKLSEFITDAMGGMEDFTDV